MFTTLVLVTVAAAPTVTSCRVGPSCSSVPLSPAEAAALSQRCEQQGGTVAAGPCDTTGDVAVCKAGDYQLTSSLADLAPAARAGQLKGFSARCFALGGDMEKPARKPTRRSRTKLKLAPLPLTTTASSDCDVAEQFGSASLVCGSGERPEVSLTVIPVAVDDTLYPRTPDAAVATKENAVETRREVNKAGWTVEYTVAQKFRGTAYGFVRALTVGGANYLCEGSAFSAVDLKEALALCADLKR